MGAVNGLSLALATAIGVPADMPDVETARADAHARLASGVARRGSGGRPKGHKT